MDGRADRDLAGWQASREHARASERAVRQWIAASIVVGALWRVGAVAGATGVLVLVMHLLGASWNAVVLALAGSALVTVIWIVVALAEPIAVWRRGP